MYTEEDYISDEDKSRENWAILCSGAKSSADGFKSALNKTYDWKSDKLGNNLFENGILLADYFESAVKEAHDVKSDKLGNNPFESNISLADDFGHEYSDPFYYNPFFPVPEAFGSTKSPSITDIRPIWHSIRSSSVTLVQEFGPENGYGGFKKWQKGKVIGSGSFGTVYEGLDEGGHFIAAKEVSLHDQSRQGIQRIIQLQQEISLLSQLSHPNIVQYRGTYRDVDKLYIFLELVTNGSLADIYGKYDLGDSQVSAYTRQILNGLIYLHERNVVHRDIKCANLLVDASGSVKLADFGMAKTTTLNGLKSCIGTPYWMAPEVVNSPTDEGYGLAADIWSFGCTVLEMLTRKIPYSHLDWMPAVVLKISKGELPEIPNTLSSEAQDFILKCLQVNPEDRPTATQLLDHPFLKIYIPTSMNSALACPHCNATH